MSESWEQAPERSWVDVAGGRLHVERYGEGPTLVLLHGWSLDGRMFAPLVPHWAQDFDVIVPDRRGFGRSTGPPSLARELDDLDRLLESMAVESTHLLGFGQGGRVALRYAATRPARLRSLVLQGATVDGFVPHPPKRENRPGAPSLASNAVGSSGVLGAVRPPGSLPHVGDHSADSRQPLESVAGRHGIKELLSLDAADDQFALDVIAALSNFMKPTLLLTGARESASRKAHARALLEAIPNARERILNRSGHAAYLSEADRFVAAVTEFVSRIERERGR